MEHPAPQGPDPLTLHPLKGHERLCFLKNIITRPTIEVGDYTYYDDFDDVRNFERNVRYHFDFIGDRLVIGRFCMIASDVTFIMNGGNHLVDAVSAYPFEIFGHGWEGAMEGLSYPHKGDTVVGNDVWIGYRATIMPGVRIGDGAIIASCAVVTRDVEPYSIVAGNPAREVRKRFAPADIDRLLKLRWWDRDADWITRNARLLHGKDIDSLEKVL
jgi:virginiamycin A acetyltransferase